MADAVYGLARKKFLDGDIDMLADDIKISLVDSAVYTVSIDTDEFFDDIASVVATSANLSSKTTTLGVFDAANTVFTSVTGAVSEAIVVWKDTGTPSTSPLIAYNDSATGLPVTPNGTNINVSFDAGANKIFKL